MGKVGRGASWPEGTGRNSWKKAVSNTEAEIRGIKKGKGLGLC